MYKFLAMLLFFEEHTSIGVLEFGGHWRREELLVRRRPQSPACCMYSSGLACNGVNAIIISFLSLCPPCELDFPPSVRIEPPCRRHTLGGPHVRFGSHNQTQIRELSLLSAWVEHKPSKHLSRKNHRLPCCVTGSVASRNQRVL